MPARNSTASPAKPKIQRNTIAKAGDAPNPPQPEPAPAAPSNPGSGLQKLDRLKEEYRRQGHGGRTDFPRPTAAPRRPPGLERAAAAVCIRKAIDATPGLAEALDGGRLAVAVTVTDRSWVRPTAAIVAAVLHEYCQSRSASPKSSSSIPPEDGFWESGLGEGEGAETSEFDLPDALPNWTILYHHSDRLQDPAPLDEAAADSLARGLGVVFVAAAGERLPSAFAQAVDFKLAFPALDWAGLASAIEECSGQRLGPGQTLPDELCALLGPLDLRLAARAATAVDKWVDRLTRVALARIPMVQPDPAYLPGMPEFVKWAESLRRDITDYRDGRIAWHEVAGRGVVLAGPPGTGKTRQLVTLAAKCGLPLVTASHGQWQAAGHQGDMLAAMRRTFDYAARQAPCIIFIDELDAFPKRGNEGNPRHESYNRQVMSFFLELLDGAGGRAGIIVVGACNFFEMLDPALIRPGRMEKVIMVGIPDEEALAEILRYHLGKDVLANADLSGIAAMAAGSTGADCELAVRRARQRARTEGREMVLADLEAQFLPPESPPDLRSPAVRRLCAIHEAGHAVAATLLRPGFLVGASISPLQDGSDGLAGTYYSTPTVEVLGQTDMLALIRILLAGRAAEEIFLGAPSSGAGGGVDSDLARATVMVASMLSNFGFGGQLAWTGEVTAENLPQIFAMNPALAKRVEQVLGTQYGSVLDLISHYRTAVEAIADHLFAHQAISATEVAALLIIDSNINHQDQERTIQ